MRLAFCLFKYFPFGGLQRKLVQIAEECRQRGHSIDIFTSSWDGPVPEGFRVTQVPARGRTNHGAMRAYIDAVRPMIERSGFDAVVGFNKMPGLDVYYAADFCYRDRAHRIRPWLYRLTPRYRNYADFERAVFDPRVDVEVMVLSEIQRAPFIEHYGTPPERFHLLPPGISRDRMAPVNARELRGDWREQFAVRDEHKVLLMVGSNFGGKGVGRALVGLAAMSPPLRERTRLFVVGDDDEKPFLHLAEKLGVGDHLTIFPARPDILRFFLGADLFVHPASRGETGGNVILEALVAGLPVLVTESCGYAFHVARAQAGVLLSVPFRQDEFNRKLEEMLTSPAAAAWSKNGIAYGWNEDLYSLAETAADLIERAAEKKLAVRKDLQRRAC